MNAAVDFGIEQIANAAPVFYSQSVGIIFSDSDAIRFNTYLRQEMKAMSKDLITKKNGSTSFQIDSAKLGFFMHMIYAAMPEGFVAQADWDGIFPFMGTDNDGNPALFNAQLVTIRQVAESLPVPTTTSNLH